MHPIRKQRLQIVLLIVIASSLAAMVSRLYARTECQLLFYPVAGIRG